MIINDVYFIVKISWCSKKIDKVSSERSSQMMSTVWRKIRSLKSRIVSLMHSMGHRLGFIVKISLGIRIYFLRSIEKLFLFKVAVGVGVIAPLHRIQGLILTIIIRKFSRRALVIYKH